MSHTSSAGYLYIHPAQISGSILGTENGKNGKNILFSCLECGGKASICPAIWSGHCFTCGKLYCFHSSVTKEDIQAELAIAGIKIDLSQPAGKQELEIIIPEKLSQDSLDYIASRGIEASTVELFPGLMSEYVKHGHKNLIWLNESYRWEIRGIKSTFKGSQKGGTKDITVINKGNNKAMVLEGIFDFLSYVQLQGYDPEITYIVMNSTSNKDNLIEYIRKSSNISQLILSLDNDEAGKKTMQAIQSSLDHINIVEEFPGIEGDWNDYLLKKLSISEPIFSVPPASIEIIYSSKILTARDIERYLDEHHSIILTEPCGSGKTEAALELAAQQWDTLNPLITAEKVESLERYKNKLIRYGAPEEAIGVYYYNSDDLKKDKHVDWKNWTLKYSPKPIALVPHARLKLESATLWMTTCDEKPRRLLIVDEPLDLVHLVKSNLLSIPGLITELTDGKIKSLAELQLTNFTEKDIRSILLRKDNFIEKLVNSIPILPAYNIELLENKSNMTISNTPEGAIRRRHFYINYIKALFSKRFKIIDNMLNVLIYVAPELNWLDSFEKAIVLDATGRFSPFYSGFNLIGESPWYKEVEMYHFDYELKKSNIIDYKTNKITSQLFLSKILQYIIDTVKPDAKVYLVTWKRIKDFVIKLVPSHWEVNHYGETRGSNDFLICDTVVILGDFILPPDVTTAMSKYYENVQIYSQAFSETLQEIYRSRIRVNQPITIYHFGTNDIKERLSDFFEKDMHLIDAADLQKIEVTELVRSKLGKHQRHIMQAIIESGTDGISLKDLKDRLNVRDLHDLLVSIKRINKDGEIIIIKNDRAYLTT